MQEYLLQDDARKQILKTFKLIKDLIVPTMGARGLMAGIDNGWGQPNLTDDGVTVAKALNNLSGWDRTIAKAIIEAAHTTEAEAFDGTTLTVLLTYLLYELGYKEIKGGAHPNQVSDIIESEINLMLKNLEDEVIEMTPEMVEDVATIATKMPEMGKIIKEAYEIVGKDMDVIVKWDRNSMDTTIEHVKGYSINSGFSIPVFEKFGTHFDHAAVALMKSGLTTEVQLKAWMNSIPKEGYSNVIYFVLPSFNPESMRRIIQFHQKNGLGFNFVFLQGADIDQTLQDLAALTGAKIQDPAFGIKNYEYDMCGTIASIDLEKTRCILEADEDDKDIKERIEERIKVYKDIVHDEKFTGSSMQKINAETKLAALQHGVATINVGSPTEAGFTPVKLKLDDAKGAVYKSFQEGVVPGGGRTLINISRDSLLSEVMKKPFEVILKNAGISLPKDLEELNHDEGVDVLTGDRVNLIDAGIIDSVASIKRAMINASSIATHYLRVYMLIKEKEPTKQ